jgi:hypothetical protein
MIRPLVLWPTLNGIKQALVKDVMNVVVSAIRRFAASLTGVIVPFKDFRGYKFPGGTKKHPENFMIWQVIQIQPSILLFRSTFYSFSTTFLGTMFTFCKATPIFAISFHKFSTTNHAILISYLWWFLVVLNGSSSTSTFITTINPLSKCPNRFNRFPDKLLMTILTLFGINSPTEPSSTFTTTGNTRQKHLNAFVSFWVSNQLLATVRARLSVINKALLRAISVVNVSDLTRGKGEMAVRTVASFTFAHSYT